VTELSLGCDLKIDLNDSIVFRFVLGGFVFPFVKNEEKTGVKRKRFYF
jgi:hypothetical protein